MNARINLQLSTATNNGAFDTFYKDVYPIQMLPFMYVSQHASVVPEDANMFKSLVYGSKKLINVAIKASVGR